MDTRQLKTFVTLAEEGTYLRTSIKLNYAPATLTEHIRALERETGVRLFRRDGKASTLTREGEAFLPYARKLLATQRQALDAIGRASEARRPLRVAMAASLGQYALGPMMRDFASSRQDCALQIQVGNCAEFVARLTEGSIDAAYAYKADVSRAPGVELLPLYDEPICLVAHPSHPLCGRSEVHPEDLEGERFAFTYGNCTYTQDFLRQLAQHGVTLGSEDYLGNIEMIKQSVIDNYGMALLTACSTRREREEGRMVALRWAGEALTAPAQMLYRRGEEQEHPALAALISQTLRTAREICGDGVQDA